ncbi:MAG: hypothetical protein ACYDBV_08655 [Nitrospiria bacterium]
MTEIQSDEAYKNNEKVNSVKKGLQGTFLTLAALLKENRDKEYYKVLDYETFEDYIASPELSFDRSVVYRLIQVYEKFAIEYNVAPARLIESDYSKLAEIVPVVNQDNYEEWLDKAISLSRSDLRAELREFRGEPELLHERAVEGDQPEHDLAYYANICRTNKSGRAYLTIGEDKFCLSLIREEVVPSTNGSVINELIELFKPINPSYAQFYKIIPQRQSLERLLEQHGVEKTRRLIEALPKVIGEKYAPRITTPVQLENKLGDLLVFIKQKGNNGQNLDLRTV